jgi:hypothetical protein
VTQQAALSTTTPVSLLRMLDSVVVHQALYAAAALGVADLLIDQPRTTADLGIQLQVHEGALYRILRALAGEGIFEETAPRTFANNEVSWFLATGRDAMKSAPISGVMTNWPFGLRWPDASLARNLL